MADGSYPIIADIREAERILIPSDEAAVAAILEKALQDSMLGGGDRRWFNIRSVRESLSLQLRSLGDIRRDFGDISFLTHLMEVTHRVYNHPRLAKFPAEYRAFVPANHDLEDICKKLGLAPSYVIARALALLSDKANFSADAKHSLFLLMDPPNVLGDDRKRMQIERASQLDLVAVYTRYFDKYCTYARDLRNMLTINPETGRPFFEIKSEQEAAAYAAKLDRKQEVIMALPVALEDKRAWLRLRHKIDQMIAQQIEPMVAERVLQRKTIKTVPALMPRPIRPAHAPRYNVEDFSAAAS